MGTRKRSQAEGQTTRAARRPHGAPEAPCAAARPPASARHASAARHASIAVPRTPSMPGAPVRQAVHAVPTASLSARRPVSAAQRASATPASTSGAPRRSQAPAPDHAPAREHSAAAERTPPPSQPRGMRVPSAASSPATSLRMVQVGATGGHPSLLDMPRAAMRPGAATDSGHRHFSDLRAALAEGWEIVQPIFARPLWSTADDSATAFNFVLHGPRGTRLITVPQGTLVERFIRDRRLSVDYAR